MIPRYPNRRSWRCLSLAFVTAACGAVGHHDAPQDTTRLAAASPKPLPDVMRLLALDAALSPTNVGSRMTCIPIDAAGQSRLLYMLLPAESSYVRLTVVAARGAVEMADLVRGIPDGRIWSATAEGARGSATALLFASASDKSPAIDVWPAGDPRARRLLDVASTAIHTPCAAQ